MNFAFTFLCMVIILKVILIVGLALHFKRELKGFIWFSHVTGLYITSHILLRLQCFVIKDFICQLNFVCALSRWLEKLLNTFYLLTHFLNPYIYISMSHVINCKISSPSLKLKHLEIFSCLGKPLYLCRKSCVI